MNKFRMIWLMRGLGLAAIAGFLSGPGQAQSVGATVYKSNCQTCHGASGKPTADFAKMTGVKAASDPEIKKLTAAQEFDAVKNGRGKMKPFAGRLTDSQIRGAVGYFRTLK